MTSIFEVCDQAFSKNVKNKIQAFGKRRWKQVEKWGKGNLHPLQEIQQLFLRQGEPKIASVKVQENAEGSASSKSNLTRDSDALLTLLREIIHGDPDSSGIYSPCCGKGPVQARFAKYLTQYKHTNYN
jgi:hypothetical protein